MNTRKLCPLFFVILLLCLMGSAVAQEDHSADSSKVERKNRAPVSKDVLKVTLPRATEATLSNGLTVLFAEREVVKVLACEGDGFGG